MKIQTLSEASSGLSVTSVGAPPATKDTAAVAGVKAEKAVEAKAKNSAEAGVSSYLLLTLGVA